MENFQNIAYGSILKAYVDPTMRNFLSKIPNQPGNMRTWICLMYRPLHTHSAYILSGLNTLGFWPQIGKGRARGASAEGPERELSSVQDKKTQVEMKFG